jgi:hypothetical protein
MADSRGARLAVDPLSSPVVVRCPRSVAGCPLDRLPGSDGAKLDGTKRCRQIDDGQGNVPTGEPHPKRAVELYTRVHDGGVCNPNDRLARNVQVRRQAGALPRRSNMDDRLRTRQKPKAPPLSSSRTWVYTNGVKRAWAADGRSVPAWLEPRFGGDDRRAGSDRSSPGWNRP